MSASVNKVIIMGNVGRDPEIRHTQGGDAIATLSIATSEKWTDKRSGERMEKSEWHRIVIFNPHLVKIVEQYVKKGAQLYIEGEVRTRKWTGRDGEDRLSTEVVLPSYGGVLTIVSTPKGERSGGETRAPAKTDQRGNPRWDEGDDEIPF